MAARRVGEALVAEVGSHCLEDFEDRPEWSRCGRGRSSDHCTMSRMRVYDGKLLKIDLDRVELPGGKRTELEIIRHPGAAAIVPFDDDGHVLLVPPVPVRGGRVHPRGSRRDARSGRGARRLRRPRGRGGDRLSPGEDRATGLDLDDAGLHRREDLALRRLRTDPVGPEARRGRGAPGRAGALRRGGRHDSGRPHLRRQIGLRAVVGGGARFAPPFGVD